jgi:hypothetical protein
MMSDKSGNRGFISFGPEGESDRRIEFVDLVRHSPIPDQEFMLNIGLFLTPQTLSRVLFMNHLYKQILDVQGVVMEFGSRWGQSLSLFLSLRGVYEPFNRLRKVIGFDTFSGFPGVSEEDGEILKTGGYTTTPGYEDYLNKVLELEEKESPLSHIRKHEIVAGDATKTVPNYLEENPHTVIALAYFDFDLYEPTRICLEAIKPYITKGTVIGFDEVNDETTPGETVALREVLGLENYSLKRYRYNARTSYLVFE